MPTRTQKRFIFAIVIFSLLTLGALGLWGWTISWRGQALALRLGELESTARTLDPRQLPSACAQLTAVSAEAAALRAVAGPALPLTAGLGWLGKPARDLVAAAPLLAAADDLSTAGTLLCAEITLLLSPPAPGQSAAEAATMRLVAAAPQLSAAQAHLARAELTLAILEPTALSPALAARVAGIRALLPVGQEALEVALALPELLGASGRRTYLVVAQNPDELRATGGFISAAGLLSIEQGRITALSFSDSGRLDNLTGGAYPLAPDPLRRYMASTPMAPVLWTFRDANWSPDLPTAVAMMRDLYQRGQGVSADGVIVFTPTAVRLLLGAIGPVAVLGQSEPVSQANMEAYIRSVWSEAQEEGRGAERKASLDLLGEALIERVANNAELDLAAIARALGAALDRGDLAMELPGDTGRLLERRGWDGALRPGAGDFLHLSSANIGYNKVGPRISQLISYAVDLSDPAAPRAAATISQRNQSSAQPGCTPIGPEKARRVRYEELMDDCYWSYLRLYVPGAAVLVDSDVPVVPDAWMLNGDGDGGRIYSEQGEAGTRVYGALSVAPGGGEAGLSFRYLLPPEVLEREGALWRYRLRIKRQPGAAQRAELRFLLPMGATLLSASHQPQALGGQIYALELDLEQHTHDVELLFAAP